MLQDLTLAVALEAVVVDAFQDGEVLHFPFGAEEVGADVGGHERFGLNDACSVNYWEVLALFGLDVNQILGNLLL